MNRKICAPAKSIASSNAIRNAGWYVRNTIKRYLNGNTIPDEIYMPETVFSDKGNLDSIPPREY